MKELRMVNGEVESVDPTDSGNPRTKALERDMATDTKLSVAVAERGPRTVAAELVAWAEWLEQQGADPDDLTPPEDA